MGVIELVLLFIIAFKLFLICFQAFYGVYLILKPKIKINYVQKMFKKYLKININYNHMAIGVVVNQI